MNRDVLQVLQSVPLLQSLSDVQGFPQLEEVICKPHKGSAMTRLVVKVSSRKRGREVMLPQRTRVDWAGGAENTLLYAGRGVFYFFIAVFLS